MASKRDPSWMPAVYGPADTEAIQALLRGDARPEQQKRALDWIIRSVALAYEVSFRSDADGGDRDTAFAEGRRFVGLQIVKHLNMPPELKAALRTKDG